MIQMQNILRYPKRMQTEKNAKLTQYSTGVSAREVSVRDKFGLRNLVICSYYKLHPQQNNCFSSNYFLRLDFLVGAFET